MKKIEDWRKMKKMYEPRGNSSIKGRARRRKEMRAKGYYVIFTD